MPAKKSTDNHQCTKEWQLATLFADTKNMMNTMENMDRKLDQIISRQDEIDKKIYERDEKIIERIDKKYANKWTEKVLIFIWWIMWTAIVGAFLTLILKW